MSRKTISVGDFVATLRSFESEPITSWKVVEFCSGIALERSSLDRYVHFQPDTYTRNLIHRDEHFEVMALCWRPHQRTPIHTHNGQLGWVFVERGQLAVIDYRWLGCSSPENQNVVGIDCLAGGKEIELDRLRVHECGPGEGVNTVDKQQTIHQVVTQGKEPVVSIHIYSRPIDSCVAFDLSRRTCVRREMSYYSTYGEVVVETPVASPSH